MLPLGRSGSVGGVSVAKRNSRKSRRKSKAKDVAANGSEDIAVSYIAQSAAELAILASMRGQTHLAYLLQLVQIESEEVCGDPSGAPARHGASSAA
jgi:hypothetical protein